jgi:hypothetical protein
MEHWPRLATTRSGRLARAVLGVALLAGAVMASDLIRLLLIMAALVPLGAAVANVALWPGMRDTVRHWHHSE